MTSKLVRRLIPYVVIVLFSFLLLIPQWSHQELIMGSDSLFHYNRFYDTAMQIREGNFSYILSLYGFQQSGRIINALYGPLFAYVQGIIVALTPSWFVYQLVSRLLLGVMAGCSMFALLKQAKVKWGIALLLSLVYMTTFAIQYWTMRQGFSSWGAALLPFCFIPALRFVLYQKVEPIRLAISVALLFQVHVLTTLFLVVMLAPFFVYGFIGSNHKLDALLRGVLAVLLALVLTSNVWLPIIYLKGQNELLNPFVNMKMGQNGIDGSASYWLTTPSVFLVFLVVQFPYLVMRWRKIPTWEKVLHGTYLTFVLLSTGLFPWQWLVEHRNAVAELIQFPFRFFVPATLLLIVIIGRIFTEFPEKYKPVLLVILSLSAGLSGIEVQSMTQSAMKKAAQSEYVIKPAKHTYALTNYQETKLAALSSNKELLLKQLVKSTPDYLPIYGDIGEQNTYDLYYHQIIEANSQFQKQVDKGKIIVEWQSKTKKTVEPSIIVYKGTKVRFNGKIIKTSDLDLSTIGRPSLTSKVGNNRLEISYPLPFILFISLIISSIGWLVLVGYLLYRGYRKQSIS